MNLESSSGERVATWAVFAAVVANPKLSPTRLFAELFEFPQWRVLSQRLPEEALIVLLKNLEELKNG
jgi:hypothetical protein